MRAAASITVTAALLAALVAACSTTEMVIGFDCDAGFCEEPTPPPFTAPEAGVEERTLTNYCPSNQCPEGYTTCASSQFLCDVDFLSDPLNCGGCGLACPGKSESEVFDCVEGRCVMRCQLGHDDCDGIVDNGCEVHLGSSDHCRACGDVCDGVACLKLPGQSMPQCGCDPGYTFCVNMDAGTLSCARLDLSDQNCGACGNVCPTGGLAGLADLPPNAQYGCVASECGKLKCQDGYADCNSDLFAPDSDGCETRLSTHDNCTACGDDCRAQGMNCVRTLFPAITLCGCAPGLSFCGSSVTEPFLGGCHDFASDIFNCGACGRGCPGSSDRSLPLCVSGTCKIECLGRWADCNGNVDDNCEVDTWSDPQNCGGCGIACDIAAGQACAGGQCVVEPCEDGEAAR